MHRQTHPGTHAVAQAVPRPRGLSSPTSSRTFEVEKTENPLGTGKAEPSAPRASQMRGPPDGIVQAVPATDVPEGCATATVVDVEAPSSSAPAPRALPRKLATEMAKHGLTEADQRLLFREGITTVDRFQGLSDANYPTGIDVGARREAKRRLDQAVLQAQHDQAVQAARDQHVATCLNQVRQALKQAKLTDNAPRAAILKQAPNMDALRQLAEDRGALGVIGVGAHDRQQLQNFCRGPGLRLAVPVQETVPPVEQAQTEPQRRAKKERQAQRARADAEARADAIQEDCGAVLRSPLTWVFCGIAVTQYGWRSLQPDLGLWGSLVGAMACAIGFSCACLNLDSYRSRYGNSEQQQELEVHAFIYVFLYFCMGATLNEIKNCNDTEAAVDEYSSTCSDQSGADIALVAPAMICVTFKLACFVDDDTDDISVEALSVLVVGGFITICTCFWWGGLFLVGGIDSRG